jgi:hypothetical protein
MTALQHILDQNIRQENATKRGIGTLNRHLKIYIKIHANNALRYELANVESFVGNGFSVPSSILGISRKNTAMA